MTKAEIIAAIKEIDGYTAMEGKAIVDMAQMALLNKLLEQLQGSGSDGIIPVSLDEHNLADTAPVPTTLVTALSSEYDTIDVNKMSKGGVTVAHDSITATATSAEIDCRGFNTISVECAVANISNGNWLVEILGCAISGGTFGNCYVPKDDGTFAQQKTPTLSANGNTHYYFRGIPNYVQIKATRTTDGTLTCTATLMNL